MSLSKLLAGSLLWVAMTGQKSYGIESVDPYRTAIINHDSGEVKKLLQSGAKTPDSVIVRDRPLNLAASIGDLEIVKILVEKLEKTEQLKDLSIALVFACAGGYLNCAEYLTEMGADVNFATKEDGYTSLGAAASSGKIEIVEFLLKRHAKVNTHDHAGATPFMMSMMSQKKDVIKLLLDAGADINATDMHGFTSLAAAVEYNSPEMVKFLLSLKADPNIANEENKKPLDLARLKKNQTIIDLLQNAKPTTATGKRS